ncbi:flavoprotein family protein [Candidatus Colimorpha enterica]|uniref:Flavoprotein family protein n=1 Tax=Candidatus Colimorpha enterica TaxID=3083063 RepID=R6UB63_9BACT|nr:flavoprotein family protein [Candidatus Colimorpha enterica]
MQGLSLKNVAVSVTSDSGRGVYRDFGEMMFTHFGVTGPVILSASSMIPDLAPGKYILHIDLKPALDEKALGDRLLSDFSKNINRDFANSLGALLPAKMIPVFVRLSGIPGEKKVNSITKEERRMVTALLKDFPVRLSRFRPIDEAIITKGGISVKEIDPKTMQSKLVSGLFFAGEIIDVDGYTGGFNLQIAFSTAVCAAAGAIDSQ